MNNRDLIRLAPWEAIDSILAIDAKALSSNPKLFCSDNRINYDIAINSWLIAVKDYAPYAWTSLATRLTRDGLMQTVKYFTDAASELITTGLLKSHQLAQSLYTEISLTLVHRAQIPVVTYQSSLTVEGTALFLFRYLKRFTPLWADKLDTEAVSSFKRNQKRLKNLARRGYSPFILNFIRDVVNDFRPILTARSHAFSRIKMADIEITPGVVYDLRGGKLNSLQLKLDSLDLEYNYYRADVLDSSVWNYQLGNTARLTTVPKTLTSARTIAPEELLRQSIARRMFSLCCDNTMPGINLRDQSVNQNMARVGSIDDTYCTIDLSHASDDVTWLLVQEIYREYPEYLEYLSRIRPEYIKFNIDGGRSEKLLLQSFATMGNSMTFLIESEVFWSITMAAVRFTQELGIDCPADVYVYGDDIICAREAYECVVWFLQSCGFSVNEDKSFAIGPFRESCGKDYLNGVDVSSPYFPRRRLTTLLDWYRDQTGRLVTVAESLISLQHRLYDVSRGAAQYIELYLREHKPNLGLEYRGADTMDLWGEDVIPYGKRSLPEGQFVTRESVTEWNLGNYKTVTVKETRLLSKACVSGEPHTVDVQLRPTVVVETLPYSEEYLLNQYLLYGPYYASPIDEALGISTSRRLIPNGRPRSAWKKFER
jgi:hypothetical protein